MIDNNGNILDYFPEDYEDSIGFSKDDKIVLARIFIDSEEAQMAASILRVKKIPHFIADGNASLFTENVLNKERLFIREEDMALVGEELKGMRKKPFGEQEDWYEEVRTQQGYEPYRQFTYLFMFVLTAFVVILLLFFSGIFD